MPNLDPFRVEHHTVRKLYATAAEQNIFIRTKGRAMCKGQLIAALV